MSAIREASYSTVESKYTHIERLVHCKLTLLLLSSQYSRAVCYNTLILNNDTVYSA